MFVDKVEECIDILTEEIEKRQGRCGSFDTMSDIQKGRIQGLEIAGMLLTQNWEEDC